MPKITGTIKSAKLFREERYKYIGGYIYDDVRGRFKDGTYIFTSIVKKQEDDLVYTLNSVYKIESWRED